MMNITAHVPHATTLVVDGETVTTHTQVFDRDHLLEQQEARAEDARHRLTVAEASR